MFNEIVHQLDPGPGNGRNSEGSFVTLKGGRIVLAYSRFTGSHDDFQAADIAVIHSDDDGRTWSEPEVIVRNTGAVNVMSVSLLRLRDGRIAMMYLVKNGLHDCRPRMMFSSDEMATWSQLVEPIQAPGYFVVNNDRLIETSSGRLIIPAAYHRMKGFDPASSASWEERGIALWYLSDDGGATWREASSWWALPVPSQSGIQEPGVIELDRDRLMTWYRTSTGYQWSSVSSSGGETWSPPQPTRFMSPASPLSMKRMPGADKLLAVWNDTSGRFEPHEPTPESWGRTPLACAVGDSRTGETWTNHKVLEDDPERGFCYIAVHFTDDAVLLAYCAGGKPTTSVLDTLRIRRVSLDWILD